MTILRPVLLLAVLVWAAGQPLHAKEEGTAQKPNYTMFTLGAEFVQYQENTTGITGSGPRMVNVMQRSSGYTGLTDRFGYYITTASTLLANRGDEDWTLAPHGVVQRNRRIVRLADLEVLAAWGGEGWRIVGGLAAETMSFTRSGFRYPQGTRGSLSTNNQGQLVFAPDPLGGFQKVTTGGVTHYVQRQLGAVNEDSLSVLVKGGFVWDTFFSDQASPWRFLAGAYIATPIYYRVTNTEYPNSAWSATLGGGYDLSGEVAVGRRVFGGLTLLARAEGIYRVRPQTKTDPATGGFVPRVKVSALRFSVGGSWVF